MTGMELDYYDRQGKTISLNEYLNLPRRPDYKRVAETTLPNGMWVSTVWLGLDHQMGDGPPLIFESMAFGSHEDLEEVDVERYSTEAEARAGHKRMVERLTGQ